MKLFLTILVSIAIATISQTIHHAQQTPLSSTQPQPQPYQGFSTSESPQIPPNKSNPIPSQFTLQQRIALSPQGGGFFTYSPDNSFIVYTSSNHSNSLYIRNRTYIKYQTRISIGPPSTLISTFSFSPDGKFLFIGTYNASLFYTCNFSFQMTSSNCFPSFDLKQQISIIQIRTNPYQQIAMTSYGRVWIMKYSSNGNVFAQNQWDFYTTEYGYCVVNIMKWHQISGSSVIIFAGRNYTTPDRGFISIYNLKEKTFLNIPTLEIYSFQLLKDGHTLLACNGGYLVQYEISLTGITQVATLLDQNCYGGLTSLSADNTLFYMMVFKSNQYRPVQIYSVNTNSQQQRQEPEGNNPSKSSIHLSDQNPQIEETPSSLSLHLVTSMNNVSQFWSTSSDGNELLFYEGNNFMRYTLCINNTYYSNFECLKCSSSCSSCHFNENNCLTCTKSSQIPINGTCTKCNSSLPGCLLCTSLTYCLACNIIQSWKAIAVDGSCECQDYFYNNLNGSCVLCDAQKKCLTCKNASECVKCDKSKGCEEVPVDGACICNNSSDILQETQTLQQTEEQILCNIENCKSCLASGKCLECDQLATLTQGKCLIKKQSSTLIVMYVSIGGFVILVGVLAIISKVKKIKETKKSQFLISEMERQDQHSTVQGDSESV